MNPILTSQRKESRSYYRVASFRLKGMQREDGFSLLELVSVVVILGILASATLPRIGNVISSSNIDEAKSLLNTTAADCLQNSRLNSKDKDSIDETIISDKKLNTIGYEIDASNNADKCSYFQIVPTDLEDNIRFPIGFSVLDGELTKFANPTSSDKGSIRSCERWAGINCKQDENLKKLIEWKNGISAAKTACENKYTKWLTQDNTTPFKFKRWNTNAETGCPVRPPKDGSESYKTSSRCTPNGCNRVVYGLDGEFVGFSKEDYDLALEEKYGKACSNWIAEKEELGYTNDPTNIPLTKSPECGAREFWFVDGTDYGSEAALNARLIERESEKCEADRDQARKSGFVGKWGPKEGAGICTEESYICDYKIVSEYDYYKNCGKALQPKCNGYMYKENPECTDYELSDYWFKKCGERPKTAIPKNCRYVGMGKPFDREGWDKTDDCGEWARCMELY